MTGLLKDLMNDRADHAAAPRLDLDAIVADGDKRVRRRRLVTGAGIAAVAAVVVAAAAVVTGMVDDTGSDPVQRPAVQDYSADVPTYAVGSTIHYGDRTIDVSPLEPIVLTKTDHGFVFTDESEVYFADGVAPPRQLGVTSGINLVSDGPYAAFSGVGSDRAELVVFNSADGTLSRTAEGSARGSDESRDPATMISVRAMDGSRIYWHNSQGVVVSDTASPTDDPIVLMPDATSDWLLDVSQGVLARKSFDDLTVTVSRETDATEPNFEGEFGFLSPDAQYVVTFGDESDPTSWKLSEVTSGRNVSPTDQAFARSRLVNWLDAETYVVAGSETKRGPAELWTCDARTRDCAPLAEDVGPLDEVIPLYRG